VVGRDFEVIVARFQRKTIDFSEGADHLAMAASAVFRKKTTALEIPTHGTAEEPSKRTLSTAIFPAPSRIPRTFEISALESRFPTFWQDRFEHAPDGELLLTRDQVDQLREVLLKERRDQLTAEYTVRLQQFVSRYDAAARAGRSQLPPESPNYWG
jgi:hypothetical protein